MDCWPDCDTCSYHIMQLERHVESHEISSEKRVTDEVTGSPVSSTNEDAVMSDEQEHGSEYFSEDDSATLMEISNDDNFVILKAAEPEIVSSLFNSRIGEDGLEGGSRSNTSPQLD